MKLLANVVINGKETQLKVFITNTMKKMCVQAETLELDFGSVIIGMYIKDFEDLIEVWKDFKKDAPWLRRRASRKANARPKIRTSSEPISEHGSNMENASGAGEST
ncbi:MAG: hypothetical protein QXI54_08360 [Archaeoglobaceae archaeon]